MFNIGDYVKVKNTNINGKIVRFNKSRNDISYTVLSNSNKLVVKEELLEKYDKVAKQVNIYDYSINLNDYSDENLDEIMIRHQFKEEAIDNLDKFIDKAICNKKQKIKIIHGKNGGILRNAVHEYLKNNPNILKYELGNYYEGSYGVTIAYLK